MAIAKARELLKESSSSLNDLLDSLISLSKDYGYIQAVKTIGWRDSPSATESLLEHGLYIHQLKNQITNNYAQVNF